jgi:hypothetical protein
MPSTLETIRRDVEARISEVRAEIERLERAARALGGRPSAASNGRARSSSSISASTPRRRQRRAKRVPREQRLSDARAVVKENPKITGKQLAARLKISQPYAQKLLGDARPQRRRRRSTGK